MARLKRKRVSKEHNIDNGNDIISQLPDCVLHHILSFLPTKDAVAMCTLSKRWEYLWTFVPIVDVDDTLLYTREIDYNGPHDGTRFINFVDRVLRLRNASSMKKFRLFCHVSFNASRVNDWISAAIRQNVEELHLDLYADDDPVMLPCCVFDNAFIKVLKIEPNYTLGLPPRISLPHLKTLHLSRVTFIGDDLMQRLLSNCPSLEELAILHCNWKNIKNITVAMPSLKTLVIADTPSHSVDDLLRCAVKIDAINLISFEYSGCLSIEISVLNLSSLAVSLINIWSHGTMHQELGHRTFNLLRGLRSVSSLSINIGFLRIAENMLVSLPVFHNLILLELRQEANKRCTELLMTFLQFLPKLEVLHFREGLSWGEGDFNLESVPKCISSSLKTV